MDAAEIRKRISVLVGTALLAVTPSKEDRALALDYGEKITAAILEGLSAEDPAEKLAARKKAEGFVDALSLLVARYEVESMVLGRKFFSELLDAGMKIVLALLV